jgi:hypothetical protein
MFRTLWKRAMRDSSRGFQMSYRQRSRGLRLGVDVEAATLFSNLGADNAYWVARRRAEEASDEDLAKDWSRVAAAIARKSKPSLFTAMFH